MVSMLTFLTTIDHGPCSCEHVLEVLEFRLRLESAARIALVKSAEARMRAAIHHACRPNRSFENGFSEARATSSPG